MNSVKESDYTRERKIMLKYIKDGSREILDIGAGACACLSLVLAQQGYRIIAIDNEQSVLDEAREKVIGNGFDSQIDFKLEDASSLSFPDGSFMNIVAYNSLHHIQDLEKAVAEIYRVLSPEGRVIIGDFNETYEGYLDQLRDLLKSKFMRVRQIKRKDRRIFICRKAKTKQYEKLKNQKRKSNESRKDKRVAAKSS